MRFSTFLSELMANASRDEKGNYLLRDPCMTDDAGRRLNVEELALFSAIDLLAAAGSACPWLTYRENKRYQGDDWVQYNIQPNPNQNAAEFRRMLIARLLWDGEALVFGHGGHIYLADSFQRDVRAFVPNVYRGVTCNNLSMDKVFQEDEVWYFSYSNLRVSQLIANLKGLYSTALSEALDKYKRSGGRAGIVEVPNRPSGNKNFEGDVNKIMNERFKAFFSGKNAVVTLHEGWKFIPHDGPASQKSVSEVSDMEAIFRQAQDRACNALHIAPGLLRGDVTGLDDAINYTLAFGLKPILKIIETEVNRKSWLPLMKEGWYMRIDATHVKVADVFSVAEKFEKLFQNGAYSINGLLEKLDEAPLPFPWADKHFVTKNAELIDTTGGS